MGSDIFLFFGQELSFLFFEKKKWKFSLFVKKVDFITFFATKKSVFFHFFCNKKVDFSLFFLPFWKKFQKTAFFVRFPRKLQNNTTYFFLKKAAFKIIEIKFCRGIISIYSLILTKRLLS